MAQAMLEAALGYAARGWPVFPCRANKNPHTLHGVLDATTDPDKIRDWWAKWPGANVAVHCADAGFLVLDYDPGSDRRALEEDLGEALPSTRLISRTPKGGTHEFYILDLEDAPVANSTDKVSPHVDVRSFHGYVLLPPSHTAKGPNCVEGDYEWVEEGKPARRSDALLAACSKVRERSPDYDTWITEPDIPENVEKARRWLRGEEKIGNSTCRPAIQGEGGDNTTYATAAMMKGCGLSEETALEVMWEEWNHRCVPNWDYEDLAIKVRNGYSYNTSPPGRCTPAYHVALIGAQFTPQVKEVGEGTEIINGQFRFIDRQGIAHITPPRWLVPDFIQERGYGLVIGSRGTLKTFLALDAALTVATGGHQIYHEGEWRGAWDAPNLPGPVMFAAGEGRASLRTRIEAWESMHWGGKRVEKFILADPVPRVRDGDAALAAFVEGALKAHPEGYRLVVLDTVGRSMQGVSENAQEHASSFTAIVQTLQRELGCAVLALHHSSLGDDTRARGSTVFEADADMVVVLHRSSPKSRRVRIEMTKQKDAQEWEKPRWVEAKVVRLGMEKESLALTRMGLKEAVARQQEDREAEGEEASPEYLTRLQVVDAGVMEVLRANPNYAMSQRKLSEVAAVHVREGETEKLLGIKNEGIKKWLKKLQDRPEGTQSGDYYDPHGGKWRYSPPVDEGE